MGFDLRVANEELFSAGLKKTEPRWVMSEEYKGYAVCPFCLGTYIDPEWIVEKKWRYCPTCGQRLNPPQEEE